MARPFGYKNLPKVKVKVPGRKAGRPKGAKNNKLPVIAVRKTLARNTIKKRSTPYEPEQLERIGEVMAMGIEKPLPKLTEDKTNDRSYIMAMYQSHRQTMIETIPDGFPVDMSYANKYTPKQAFIAMDAYIQLTINQGQPLTLSGISLFAGFPANFLREASKGTKHPSLDFLSRMRDFVEMYNEISTHRKQNPAGSIFILKNMGWKDKLEIEASANLGALSEEERRSAQHKIQNFSE